MANLNKLAIVIPAHNEEAHITACLNAIQTAIDNLANSFNTLQVEVIVVLDSCRDDTQLRVADFVLTKGYLNYLVCDYQNVGKVRALGVNQAIAHGADWIACTDADSQVSEDWLVAQMAHLQDAQQACDMICGVVSVDSWADFSHSVKSQYLAHYQDIMGHRHIHGANLSFSAKSYQNVGGFTALPCHEDVDLVKKFEANHATIIWSNQVRVATSSRLEARASEGFADFLANLQKTTQ